jgi:hypothetical protein
MVTDVPFDVGDPGEHLESGVAAGDALADLGGARSGAGWRGVVLAAAERARHPVDRRQEAEVVAALVAQREAGVAPGGGRDAHPEVVVGLQLDGDELSPRAVAERVDDALAQGVDASAARVGGVSLNGTTAHHDGLQLDEGHSCPRRASGRPCPRS